MTDKNDFKIWTKQLDPNALSLWQEALAQLRWMHSSLWKGVTFFLTMNGILLAGIFGLASLQHKECLTGVMIVSLAIAGMLVTWVAHAVLTSHRKFYLSILLRKTLIERELGFYDQLSAGVDMSLPPSVREDFLDELASRPDTWRSEQQRAHGTITKRLFLVHEGLFCIHALILGTAFLGLLRGYFT
jgi:hypothetical protein